MIQVYIDSDSLIPAYQQVIKAIKLEILSGSIKHSDRLPSIRVLAKILKLNPNTVAKAYYNLENEGLIECKGRRGSFVKYKKTSLDILRKKIVEDEFKSFLEKAFSSRISKNEIKEIIARYSE